MKLTAPTPAPSPATDFTIRNIDIAVKKAPATGLLKCLVTSTVTAIVAIPEITAPTMLSAPPRATPASRARPSSSAMSASASGGCGPGGRCCNPAGRASTLAIRVIPRGEGAEVRPSGRPPPRPLDGPVTTTGFPPPGGR